MDLWPGNLANTYGILSLIDDPSVTRHDEQGRRYRLAARLAHAHGELFKIFEVGFDTGLMPREPGRPPHGYVHISLWHQEERDDAGIDDGWGIRSLVVQRFGRFTPFIRYGYANGGANGPTPVKHMANAGLVIDNIFGQANDRIGVDYTWTHPADRALDNQGVIDAYYRVQLTPEIQVGPTFEIIFDPVRNPDEDAVFVWGFRTRIVL